MYWFGIGLELLSACLVAEVCQASRVFLMRKEPLSMTLELSLFTAIPVDKACNYISSKLLTPFFAYILSICFPFLSVEGYRLIAESLCFFVLFFF